MKKILLSGGGTLGPVTPLLALVEFSRARKLPYEFFWIGTITGPERELIQSNNIHFFSVSSAKLRRYMDWRNFFVPWLLLVGFFQAIILLRTMKPDVVITAGAYVSIPVVYAAWLLKIPVMLHEMDVQRGLANMIMAPTVKIRTSVWPQAGAKAIG